MMTNAGDDAPESRSSGLAGGRAILLFRLLILGFAVIGVVSSGIFAIHYMEKRARRQEDALVDLNFAARNLAENLLSCYNELLELEWPLPEHERFSRALETAAHNASRPLTEARADLERYSMAVRAGKISDNLDLVYAAVAEGRLHLAAEEAQRIANKARSARLALEQRRGGNDHERYDCVVEEIKSSELAASTLRATGQDERALGVLEDTLSGIPRGEHESSRNEFQAEIGFTHLRIGRRLASRKGRDHLDKGIAALRRAEENSSRWDTPSQSSTLLFALGCALSDRAERSPAADAEGLYSEATHFLERALDGRNRKETPLGWISAQRRLAAAQGECSGRMLDHAQLLMARRAARSIRACATRVDRSQNPRGWAVAQTELGDALESYAVRGRAKERCDILGDAIAAHRRALEVATRSRHPLLWAIMKNRLAVALFRLGEASDDDHRAAALFAEAAAASRASFDVLSREQEPVTWAMAQLNLAQILTAAGRLEGRSSSDPRDEARHALEAALTVLTKEEFPQQHDWASRLAPTREAARE